VTHTLTEASIAGYSGGSDTIYRHKMTGYKYTAGVKHVAEAGGAYWLLDKIAFVTRFGGLVGRDDFEVWRLKVEGTKGVLTAEDGNGVVRYLEKIAYTDFPLPEIKIWRERDVFLLPCEH
jgi:hypothetical protein